MGGAWFGTDTTGLEVFALSTDSGQIMWIIPSTGEQGFGTASNTGGAVTMDFTYVAPMGFALVDGSHSATCTATGTIQERRFLNVNANCTTDLGATFGIFVPLTYDTLYNRDSSLSVIAGNYDDGGMVLNTSASGVIFEQIPGTGCIISGQVSIIDSRFNAYDWFTTFSNCIGDFAFMNGVTFTGLAMLDNTQTPELLSFGMTGEVEGVTVSIVVSLPRF